MRGVLFGACLVALPDAQAYVSNLPGSWLYGEVVFFAAVLQGGTYYQSKVTSTAHICTHSLFFFSYAPSMGVAD